ncbi:MAG: tetratricopeptide repeat protein [Methanomicrobiales archaeon]|nr:tetratricopeptide repeat protein [Methanomicrobiales archaeon]
MGVSRIRTVTAILLAFLLVVSVPAQDARAHYTTGLAFLDQKQYDQAISAFQQAVEINPSYFDALTSLGYAYTLTGRFDEAIATYGQALALQPNSTFTLRSLGYVSSQKGDYPQALAAFDRAVDIDPSDAAAWTSRGLALSALGRFNESITSYRNAIQIAPSSFYPWFSLGMEYYGAGMYSEAVSAFDSALAIDERSSESWNYRGLSLAALGRSQEAIESYHRGLIVDPDDAALLENRDAAEAQLRAYVGGGDSIPWHYVLVPIVLIGLAAGGFLILRAKKKGTALQVHGIPSSAPPGVGAEAEDAGGMGGPPGIHHDVFLSYSSQDKPIADAICAHLEASSVRCWIAPRDILPGTNYPRAIVDAIDGSRIMVLVFSSRSNHSHHVVRELSQAVSRGVIIVPFRIEDVQPSRDMEYLIGVPHWLDAMTPPLEQHIARLAGTVATLLSRGKESAG